MAILRKSGIFFKMHFNGLRLVLLALRASNIGRNKPAACSSNNCPCGAILPAAQAILLGPAAQVVVTSMCHYYWPAANNSAA